MTYKEMLERLSKFTPEQLECEVLYQDTNNGEFYGVRAIRDGESYGGDEVGLSGHQMLLDIIQ